MHRKLIIFSLFIAGLIILILVAIKYESKKRVAVSSVYVNAPIMDENSLSQEEIDSANAYWSLVDEINKKYPNAHLTFENGYYALHPKENVEIKFPIFDNYEQANEMRIPLPKVKEDIETYLNSSSTNKKDSPK